MPPGPASTPVPRTALLAGATGLVGGELMTQLQASSRYSRIDVLVRRAAPRAGAEPKLVFHTVDFTRLPRRFPRVDDVFIALGTTLKGAGSEAAFRDVDFGAVLAVARAARVVGARRLAVVSALGADPKSSTFYNRVKGEMESAVARLDYDCTVVAQPSLLLGNRSALGQSARPAEAWMQRLTAPVRWLIPKRVRPIAASAVAAAMLDATLAGHAGVRYLSSAKMQP